MGGVSSRTATRVSLLRCREADWSRCFDGRVQSASCGCSRGAQRPACRHGFAPGAGQGSVTDLRQQVLQLITECWDGHPFRLRKRKLATLLDRPVDEICRALDALKLA